MAGWAAAVWAGLAAVVGSGGVIFSVVVAAVAIFLLLYARRMAARGVLGAS